MRSVSSTYTLILRGSRLRMIAPSPSVNRPDLREWGISRWTGDHNATSVHFFYRRPRCWDG